MKPAGDEHVFHRPVLAQRLFGPPQAVLFRSPQFWRSSLGFALRTSIAAVAALYVAMWLQLEVPRWAMWTVLIVSPPSRGDVLRKTVARLVGTPIGCIAAVVLAGLFPQDRVGFVLGLAVWMGACGFLATRQQGYVAYGALLAGFTVAIVGAGTVSQPHQTFFTALDRGSATVVGVLFAMVASSIFNHSDDVPATLVGQICSAAAPLLNWVAERSSPHATPGEDVPFSGALLQLDTAIVNANAERPDLRKVGDWIAGIPTALLVLQSTSLELSRAPDDDAKNAVRDLLIRYQKLLSPGPSMRVASLRAESERLAEDKRRVALVPIATEAFDAAAYLLAGLEAILTLQPPARAVRKFPRVTFAPERNKSWTTFFRTFLGICLGFLIWDATAWSSGPALFSNIGTILIVTTAADDPSAGLTGFFRGSLLGCVVGIAALYLALPAFDGFTWLAIVLVPLIAFVPWSLAARLPPGLSLAYGNALLAIANTTNLQEYDFARSLESTFALLCAVILAKTLYTVIDPVGHGAARVQHKLNTLRKALDRARRVGVTANREEQLAWETSVYDDIRRIHASGGDDRDRKAAVHLLLAGRDAFRHRGLVDVLPEANHVLVAAS